MPLKFDNARAMFRAGRYVDILTELGSPDRDLSSFTPELRILLAHTFLQTGQIRRALEIVNRESGQRISPVLRSQCELISGVACRHNAEIGKALQHYQVAVQYAREGDDPAQTAWAAIQMFRLLAELHRSDELAPMLSDVRRFVTKAGDAHATAYMHDAVALMEASNGRTEEARRHLNVGRSLIHSYPNAWLEQLNLIGAFFLDFLECKYRSAIAHLEQARRLLPITGSRERTVIDCNHGHTLLVMGRFEAAIERFRALVSSDTGLARLGSIDGLARVYLAAGRLPDCEDTLDRYEALVASDQRLAVAFAGRSTVTTRIRLLIEKSSFAEAAAGAQRCLAEARILNDRILEADLTCLLAEALAGLGRPVEAARSLNRSSATPDGESGTQNAAYYRALGRVVGGVDRTLSHALLTRARRIWEEQGNRGALSELTRMVVSETGTSKAGSQRTDTTLVVNTLSSSLMLAHSPRLLAQELSNAIAALQCSPKVQVIESLPSRLDLRDPERHRVLTIGSERHTQISLVCELPDDAIKTIVLGDVLRIGAAAIELDRWREEDRNRAALWPAPPIEQQAGALYVAEEMQTLLSTARRVAPTNVPVLITGETGTGKEILARTIHAYSNRARGAFLPFNCTSTPKDMLDSQLFGHRRGSFTGAIDHFQGIIRASAGGTLFLDEIGDMGLDVQPKLLRFLESSEVHPVGDTQPVRVDVRVIAATNANLDALVANGRFRDDLFYRLNIVRLHVPPLRERRVEIPVLAHHYLQKHAQECGKGDLRLAEDTMEFLVLYRWPGNVRQLANEMRRMAALCESGAVLMPEHLSPEIAASRRTIPASERVLDPTEIAVRLDQPMAAATEHLERAMLQYALKQCGGRMEETAALLGLSRKGLYLKRQRFGIEPPEASTAAGAA
jgi:DNA-binding NtrC family response regulator/tetratricopeptide (TPR) repeat protein